MKRLPIGLLVVLGVALGLRLVLLNSSFWMDEAAQVLESRRPLNQQLQIAYDFQPPLFHLLVHAMVQVRQQEWWLRLTSLFPGVVTVYLTWKIGKVLVQRWQLPSQLPIFASWLVATSAIGVYFSQELRPYALSASFIAWSWYLLLTYVKQPSRWLLVLYLVSISGAVFSMYVAVFALGGQVVWMLFSQRRLLRTWLIGLGITIGLWLSWLPSFLEQLSVGQLLRTQLPGWSEVVSLPQWKSLFLVVAKLVNGIVPLQWSVETVVSFLPPFIILSMLFIRFVRMPWRGAHSAVSIFLFCWLVLPVLAAWLVSFFVPVLSPKRVLFILPAWALGISYAVLRWQERAKLLGCLLIVFQLIGIGTYWITPGYQRENWRGTIQKLQSTFSKNNTIVVFGWYEPFAPWQIYASTGITGLPTLAVATERMVQDRDIAEKMSKVGVYTNVLVVDYLRDLSDPQRKIEQWLEAHGYVGVESIDTQNMGFIRHYQRTVMLGALP